MRNHAAPKTTLDQQYRFFLILWAAMFGSIFFYYVVSLVLDTPVVRPDATMTNIILGLAATFAIASIVIGLQFRKKALETHNMTQFRQGFILALIFAEVVALDGLVLYLTNGWPYYWVFFVAAALVDLVHIPKRSVIEQIHGE